MAADTSVVDELSAPQRIAELSARLEEAEETLRAVRAGEIDAFIVQGPRGEQVYTLRSPEQPYRNLVEEMQEGAAILTVAGDIVYCNRQFSTMMAIPLEDVIGRPLEQFLLGPDRPAFAALRKAGCGKCRARLSTANGNVIEVYLSVSTSRSDDDTERLNLIVTDLSALLDAQSGRDRAEQESQAKDEFMAMLAHELRNPLSAISAAVQVLEASNGQNAPALRARSIIARQVHHLARLVDDLLEVGRVVTPARSSSIVAPSTSPTSFIGQFHCVPSVATINCSRCMRSRFGSKAISSASSRSSTTSSATRSSTRPPVERSACG
jgi:PAS domain S-box-containing protein